MMNLADDIADLLGTLPAELRPKEAVDDAGRLNVTATCRRLDVGGKGVVSLIRRGHLHGTRKPDGSWWFEPSEVEAARRFVRRGRGRPAIGEPVEARIPPAQLALVDSLACEAGVARSEMIRRLIGEALDLRGPGRV